MKMLRIITTLGLLSALIAEGQDVTVGKHRLVASGSTFSPTYEWVAGYASNKCSATGSSSCATAGQVFYSAKDETAGNAATATNTSASTGFLYEPSQINSLAAIEVSGSAAGTTLSPGTTISSTQTMTFYAVFNPASFTTGLMLGGSANGTLYFGLNTAGKPVLGSINYTTTAAGTTAFTTNSWQSAVWTYNNSTGAWAYYTCNTGTATANGSGTTTLSSLSGNTGILNGQHSGAGLQGYYAEWGLFLGTASNAGICSHIYSVYGI